MAQVSYVVESEPSKYKSGQRNDSAEKSNGGADHFEVPFLPDFDPSGDGNLQEASFPPIDAESAFGQPVDLEDIQVRRLSPSPRPGLFAKIRMGYPQSMKCKE